MEREKTPSTLPIGGLMGTWAGHDRVLFGMDGIDAGRADTCIRFRGALDGTAVVTNIEMRRRGCEVASAHGMLTWDQTNGGYLHYWVDSLQALPSMYRGQRDGNIWTWTEKSDRCRTRIVYRFANSSALQREIAIRDPYGRWQSVIEGLFHKV